MATLYIRDVDEDVTRTLKNRAAAAGLSLSAYVGTQLTAIARRPTNATIVERLRDRDRRTGPGRDDILAALEADRR